MKIYLASPFFNSQERKRVEKVADFFKSMGHTVYVPMEHEIENAWLLSNKDWGKAVFVEDTKAIRECDWVVAILNYGMTDDAGTCWEIGFAHALEKKIILVVDNRLQSLMTMSCADRIIDIDSLNDLEYDTIEVK
jgi:nucleoside 2-deoxyribosyltransferase